MSEPGQDAAFPSEPFPARPAHQSGVQKFHRGTAFESAIASLRQPHGPHPALADRRYKGVRSDGLSCEGRFKRQFSIRPRDRSLLNLSVAPFRAHAPGAERPNKAAVVRVQHLSGGIRNTNGERLVVGRIEIQQGLDFSTNLRSDPAFGQDPFSVLRREVGEFMEQQSNVMIHWRSRTDD